MIALLLKEVIQTPLEAVNAGKQSRGSIRHDEQIHTHILPVPPYPEHQEAQPPHQSHIAFDMSLKTMLEYTVAEGASMYPPSIVGSYSSTK